MIQILVGKIDRLKSRVIAGNASALCGLVLLSASVVSATAAAEMSTTTAWDDASHAPPQILVPGSPCCEPDLTTLWTTLNLGDDVRNTKTDPIVLGTLLRYVGDLAALVASISALAAAVAAWRAARATRVASEASLLARFLEVYASKPMGRALKSLTQWQREHGPNFAPKWSQAKTSSDPHTRTQARKVDTARRRLAHYFYRSVILYESKYVPVKFVRTLGRLDGYAVLYDIVHPLECQFTDNFPYFDSLVRLCGEPVRDPGVVVTAQPVTHEKDIL